MKTAERDEARTLRRQQGQSIKEIARALGVSPSSVSRWVTDIELSTEQELRLRLRNPIFNAQVNGARSRSAKARALRAQAQGEGRLVARSREPLHVAGCMLYWAEGTKARNVVQLSSSEPEMVRLFLRFLRRYFAVTDERVRIQCNIHVDSDPERERIERAWLRELGLRPLCLTKSIINSVSRASLGKRTNFLPLGTCRLTVHSTAIVQHIYGAIQEYGGFEREAWLDCLPRAA